MAIPREREYCYELECGLAPAREALIRKQVCPGNEIPGFSAPAGRPAILEM